MTRDQYSYFMKAQFQAILVYKWIESEKAGRDLGQECCHDWIKKYAADFRTAFEEKIKKGEIK